MGFIETTIGRIDAAVASNTETVFGVISADVPGVLTLAGILGLAWIGISGLLSVRPAPFSSYAGLMLRYGLVVGAVMSWDFFGDAYDILTTLPAEIGGTMLGEPGDTVWGKADGILDMFGLDGQECGIVSGSFTACIRDVIGFVVYVLFATVIILIVGGAKIGLAFAIGLAPVFVACAMFRATGTLFATWSKWTLGFALTPMLAVGLAGLVIGIATEAIGDAAQAAGDEEISLADLLTPVVMALTGGFLVAQVPSMAGALSGSIVASATGLAAQALGWGAGAALSAAGTGASHIRTGGAVAGSAIGAGRTASAGGGSFVHGMMEDLAAQRETRRTMMDAHAARRAAFGHTTGPGERMEAWPAMARHAAGRQRAARAEASGRIGLPSPEQVRDAKRAAHGLPPRGAGGADPSQGSDPSHGSHPSHGQPLPARFRPGPGTPGGGDTTTGGGAGGTGSASGGSGPAVPAAAAQGASRPATLKQIDYALRLQNRTPGATRHTPDALAAMTTRDIATHIAEMRDTVSAEGTTFAGETTPAGVATPAGGPAPDGGMAGVSGATGATGLAGSGGPRPALDAGDLPDAPAPAGPAPVPDRSPTVPAGSAGNATTGSGSTPGGAGITGGASGTGSAGGARKAPPGPSSAPGPSGAPGATGAARANFSAADWRHALAAGAREMLGAPNPHLSTKTELRYGTNGALSVDLATGGWSDFEQGTGGGAADLVIHQGHARTRGEAVRWYQDRGWLPGASGTGGGGTTGGAGTGGAGSTGGGSATGGGSTGSAVAAKIAQGRAQEAAQAPHPSQGSHAAQAAETSQRAAHAARLFAAAGPAAGTPAAGYLAGRGWDGAPPAALRFHPALRHGPTRQTLPAMVAEVRHGATGAPMGIHRTFLAPSGAAGATGAGDAAGAAPAPGAPGAPARADVPQPKMTYGPVAGGAVQLGAPAPDRPLLVGEGIETTLAAMRASGHPGWAALSTSGMAALTLPETVRSVTLLADNDASGAGLRAAERAAARWTGEGRTVRIAMPDRPGQDFADLLAADPAGTTIRATLDQARPVTLPGAGDARGATPAAPATRATGAAPAARTDDPGKDSR